jgi:hypothetical protein
MPIAKTSHISVCPFVKLMKRFRTQLFFMPRVTVSSKNCSLDRYSVKTLWFS